MSHLDDRLVPLLAASLEDPLVVVDVGARWGAGERWRRFGPQVRVIGFDPDEEECARLRALEPDDGVVTYVPMALGASTGAATLYTTVERPARRCTPRSRSWSSSGPSCTSFRGRAPFR